MEERERERERDLIMMFKGVRGPERGDREDLLLGDDRGTKGNKGERRGNKGGKEGK